jgi:hypothetical protein
MATAWHIAARLDAQGGITAAAEGDFSDPVSLDMLVLR